jgi:hypothetical protein
MSTTTDTYGQLYRRETITGTVKTAHTSSGHRLGNTLEDEAGHRIMTLTVGEQSFLQSQPEGHKVTIVREMFCTSPESATDPGKVTP